MEYQEDRAVLLAIAASIYPSGVVCAQTYKAYAIDVSRKIDWIFDVIKTNSDLNQTNSTSDTQITND